MWIPSSEAELLEACDTRALAESAHLDVKASVGTSNGDRRETAKDISSFAIDGGTLVVGVAEDKVAKTFSLAPVELADLMERVEQIAQNRVDPPLAIRVKEIPSVQEGRGYLVIEISPSPMAPHMVDGVYYARGERTTRRLTDAEVSRLIRLRTEAGLRARELLADEESRDPYTASNMGRLFLVAEPRNAPAQMARLIAWDAPESLFAVRDAADNLTPGLVRAFTPSLAYAHSRTQRSGGAALTSLSGGGRQPGPRDDESSAVDLEVTVEGGVRLMVGGMTDGWGDPPVQVIVDGLLVAYLFKLITLASEVSRLCEFHGTWDFGVRAVGLAGLQSNIAGEQFGLVLPRYDRDDFESVASATTFDLSDRAGDIARSMCEPLLRSLGTWPRYAPLFDSRAGEPA